MGESLQRWQSKQQPKQEPKELSREERRALHRLRHEARVAGAVLASAGRGGLSPSLALTIFRRDNYRCKACGDSGAESGGLQLHHKGGLENPTSRWLAKMGKRNEPNNLTTICSRCHDQVHREDRARGEGDADDQ